MQKILAFETSCDDTAVAILEQSGRVLAESIFSQLEEHAPYGGVVPEVGSRAHIEQILHVTKETFKKASLKPDDIDAVAATFTPGLLGPLLVGAQFAKGFALARSLPLIGVHHIEGHIFAGFGEKNFPKSPFLALIASGGHTAIYSCSHDHRITTVGETLDDAAGEAFDKIGRALGLGYPAGRLIDELALEGDKDRFIFPVALKNADGYDFSFSGLKTKALLLIKEQGLFRGQDLADFCASFREAVAKALCQRALKACRELGINSLVLGGGVSANSRVRSLMTEYAGCELSLYLPKVSHCTDNAAMIGKAAIVRMAEGRRSDYSLDACASWPIEESEKLTFFC